MGLAAFFAVGFADLFIFSAIKYLNDYYAAYTLSGIILLGLFVLAARNLRAADMRSVLALFFMIAAAWYFVVSFFLNLVASNYIFTFIYGDVPFIGGIKDWLESNGVYLNMQWLTHGNA
jgi:hypothetical protein